MRYLDPVALAKLRNLSLDLRRVVSVLGEPLDGKGPLGSQEFYPVEVIAPRCRCCEISFITAGKPPA